MQSPPALFRVWRGRGATSRASPASRQKSLPSGLSYSDRCYRIALLSNRDDPVKANQMRETEAAARALGMTVQVNWVRDGADFRALPKYWPGTRRGPRLPTSRPGRVCDPSRPCADLPARARSLCGQTELSDGGRDSHERPPGVRGASGQRVLHRGCIHTPRSLYPSFQVLSRTLLKTASDSLLGSRYYAHFSPPVRLPWHVAHGPPAASYVPTVSSRNGVYSTSQLSCLGDEARERSAHLPRRLHEGQSTLECRDAAAVRRSRSLGR